MFFCLQVPFLSCPLLLLSSCLLWPAIGDSLFKLVIVFFPHRRLQHPGTLLAFSSQRTDATHPSTPASPTSPGPALGRAPCIPGCPPHPHLLLPPRITSVEEENIHLRACILAVEEAITCLLSASPAPGIKIETADYIPLLVTVTPTAPDRLAPLRLKEVNDLLPKFPGSSRCVDPGPRTEHQRTHPHPWAWLTLPPTSAGFDEWRISVHAGVSTWPEWKSRILERFGNLDATRDVTREFLNLWMAGYTTLGDLQAALDLRTRGWPEGAPRPKTTTTSSIECHVAQSPLLATLHPFLFAITSTPNVDLFATAKNRVIPSFISAAGSPDASRLGCLGRHAFLIAWTGNRLWWANPPRAALNAVIPKIVSDGTPRFILVTPLTNPLSAQLTPLCRDYPILLPPAEDLFLAPDRQGLLHPSGLGPPLWGDTVVWLLSGDPSTGSAFRSRVGLIACSLPLASHPTQDGVSLTYAQRHRALTVFAVDTIIASIPELLSATRSDVEDLVRWGPESLQPSRKTLRSCRLHAINTGDSIVHPVHLPNGLSTTPAHFARVIDATIGPDKWDAITNYFNNLAGHAARPFCTLQALRPLFTPPPQGGIRLPHILKFLVLPANRNSGEKHGAIVDWPPLDAAQGLWAFVGLLEFYSCFIPDFVLPQEHKEHRHPNLPHLVTWTAQLLGILDLAKLALTTAPCLAAPQSGYPFASRVHHQAQIGVSGLGLGEMPTAPRGSLVGDDHKLHGWANKLSTWGPRMTFVHVEGTRHIARDALSRWMPIGTTTTPSALPPNWDTATPDQTCFLLNYAITFSTLWFGSSILQALLRDLDCDTNWSLWSEVQRALSVPADLRTHADNSATSGWAVDDGSTALCLILAAHHDNSGHFNAQRTLAAVAEIYFALHLPCLVAKYVAACVACQKSKDHKIPQAWVHAISRYRRGLFYVHLD
ncbi:hypothetical protein BDK51DRAFT_29844 [Blyttiomyces helicus]|uniref:Integrase zinc-binding domain-containing protein n=1 Tax=Blyttiomyces helicus TaxID=388810 RepID=A0A4P9WRE8_9FUNG|nr:hypothetical protein BDK51DRAFT_29844 [Blyttiomyces helicus]|eukprot:RKO94438.1 hypothetical protein BDK51DRAFT_29844 [Blyttiomyces helicus]